MVVLDSCIGFNVNLTVCIRGRVGGGLIGRGGCCSLRRSVVSLVVPFLANTGWSESEGMKDQVCSIMTYGTILFR